MSRDNLADPLGRRERPAKAKEVGRNDAGCARKLHQAHNVLLGRRGKIGDPGKLGISAL
jgi:hypothetical protein